jgi:hypothetical protein
MRELPPSACAGWDRDGLLASPWFRSLAPVIAELPGAVFPEVDRLSALAVARGVVSGGGVPLRFVPHDSRADSSATAYERRIHQQGLVPTRPGNLHDLFNALVWLGWPATKATLNRLHEREIAKVPYPLPPGARGTARDVLTLFDEGGIVVATADAALAGLLAGFRWKELFVQRRREAIECMRFHVFGHAIHERALAPFRGVTAKALVLEVDDAFLRLPLADEIAVLDARAAEHFARAESLASTRALAPLPVLGIPGWTAANEDPAYYDDVGHFRPGRRSSAVAPK